MQRRDVNQVKLFLLIPNLQLMVRIVSDTEHPVFSIGEESMNSLICIPI